MQKKNNFPVKSTVNQQQDRTLLIKTGVWEILLQSYTFNQLHITPLSDFRSVCYVP